MAERRFDKLVIRQMSDEDIKGIFDELIEAWEGRAEVVQERAAFNQKYFLPEPPVSPMESVEALMEYNRQKWRYEDRKKDIDTRLSAHEENGEALSGVVQRLLPESHSVLHLYGGSQPKLQGAKYEITHTTRFVERGPRAVRTRIIRVQRT